MYTFAFDWQSILRVPTSSIASVVAAQASTSEDVPLVLSELEIIGEPVTAPLPHDAIVNLHTMSVRAGGCGLALHEDHGTTLFRTAPDRTMAEPNPAELPALLRHETGLAVEMLATAIGVSKVTYHKWLNGASISEEHRARLSRLRDTLRTLTEIRRRDRSLRAFLESTTPLGRPVDLLTQGRDGLVIGLAMRGGSAAGAAPCLDDAATTRRVLSGEPAGRIRRVRSVGWNRSGVDVAALEELNPRALPEAPHPDAARDDEEPIVAGHVVVEG